MRLTWRTVPYLLQRSVLAAIDDNCFAIAKGAAYSALLSFFPILASAAAIFVQTRAQFVVRAMQQVLPQVVPPGTEEVVLQQFRVQGARPLILLIVAALVSLWAASSVVKSLMEGFQAAYRVPKNRDFLRNSGIAIALVLMTAAPLIGACALVLFGERLERQVLNWMRVDVTLSHWAWLWQALSRLARYSLAFLTTVFVTGLLYYFGPYRPQKWSRVLPGAVVATLLWLLATMGFAWYVRHLARYNVMYGSIATSILLLVWMYLMAAIALLGCEFNAEFERLQRAGLQAPDVLGAP